MINVGLICNWLQMIIFCDASLKNIWGRYTLYFQNTKGGPLRWIQWYQSFCASPQILTNNRFLTQKGYIVTSVYYLYFNTHTGPN